MYPKQAGVIPSYDGPPPISLDNEPQNLDEAVKRGHTEKIHFFIKNNPEQINVGGFHKQTPLHLICMRSDDIMAQVLIEAGADVNLATKHGETPLLLAAQAGSVPLIDLLVRSGADTKCVDNNGLSTSHYVVSQGFIVPFHYMLEFNMFDFNARDKNGNTPLHYALDKAKYDIALEILKLRPELGKEQNKMGQIPMHICAARGTWDHCAFAWKMMEICGNVVLNIKDLEGLSPITLAEKGTKKESGDCKDNCKDHGCGDKKKSLFGQTFGIYKRLSTFNHVGPRLQTELFWALPKFFWSCLLLSMLLTYYEAFNKYTSVMFVAALLLILMKIMKAQTHRIPHVSGLPNTIFKGFFIATTTTCFLSFVLNIYPKLPTEYLLISLMLQFPFLIIAKYMLNADAYEVLQSDRHEGIEAIINKKYKPYEYCGAMKMILPPQQTKYCKITKKAIKGFDHHCLFLMKSIGHGTHHYFLIFMMLQVTNQMWYVYSVYNFDWVPAGMEIALCSFCIMGSLSGSFLIVTQLMSISRRGTQYFRGTTPPSVRNIFEFFFRHEKYAQSLSRPRVVDHV